MTLKRLWIAGVRPPLFGDVKSALSAWLAVGLTCGLGASSVAARINPSLHDAQDATRFLLGGAAAYLALLLPISMVGLLSVRWIGFRPRRAPQPKPERAPQTESPGNGAGRREAEARISRFPFSTHALVVVAGVVAYWAAVVVGTRFAGLSESRGPLVYVALGLALAGVLLAAFATTRQAFQGLIGPRRWLVPIVLVFLSGLFLLLGLGGTQVAAVGGESGASVLGKPSRAGAGEEGSQAGQAPPHPRRVVLLALDGADWVHIDALLAAGELPSFRRLLGRGVRTTLRGERPAWPTVAWTTVATGVPPRQHAVCDVTEVLVPGLGRGLQRAYAKRGEEPLLPLGIGLRPLLEELLDRRLLEERLVRSTQRRAKAVWNVLSERGLQVAVVRWPASYPAEVLDGWVLANDDPWTGDADVRRGPEPPAAARGLSWPPELGERLADLHPSLRSGQEPQALAVGPSPPPAAAPAPQSVITSGPPVRSQLAIFERLSREEWALLEDEPHLQEEAAAVLAADELGMKAALRLWREERPWFLALCLRGIDVLGHRLERMPGAIEGSYRWTDQALGGLLDALGEDATLVVLSAYGWEHAPDPARILLDGAPEGILVLAGSGVRQGVEFDEPPSLYDIAPTLLALYGIPASAEMPGRALIEALDVATRPPGSPRPRSFGRFTLRTSTDAGLAEPEVGPVESHGQ